MANKVTFDWSNLLIIVNNGVTELDVQIDLYSDWKEDVKIGDNGKHPIAFRNVGGDPISGTQSLGSTYFLLNGWKIRPYEGDHQLNITGNLFTDPFGEDIVIPTLGDYTVLVSLQVSNLAVTVEGVDSSLIRKTLTNRLDTDPVTGVMTLYDDDDSPLKTAQLYEDVAGTQTYRGTGAERREKLT
jgi:hypothetical protein